MQYYIGGKDWKQFYGFLSLKRGFIQSKKHLYDGLSRRFGIEREQDVNGAFCLPIMGIGEVSIVNLKMGNGRHVGKNDALYQIPELSIQIIERTKRLY